MRLLTFLLFVLVLVLGLLPCGAVAWLFLFLGVFGAVVLLFCMSYGLMCCSFVDGCVASVVFIRCIPDLGVGVSSFIVLFFCCFYLIKIAALIFSFSSF